VTAERGEIEILIGRVHHVEAASEAGIGMKDLPPKVRAFIEKTPLPKPRAAPPPFGSEQRRTYDAGSKTLQVPETVIDFITAIGVGGPAIALVVAALNAMKKVGDNHR